MSWMKVPKGLVATVAIVSVAALSVVACGGVRSPGSAADVRVMSPEDFTVNQFAGKPLVVNFFASWCGPCNMEAPDVAVFAKAHIAEAAIVGIAVNDQEGDIVDFIRQYGLTYPVVLDDGSLDAEYGITGVPTTIFFNASGREVDRIVGASVTTRLDIGLAKAM